MQPLRPPARAGATSRRSSTSIAPRNPSRPRLPAMDSARGIRSQAPIQTSPVFTNTSRHLRYQVALNRPSRSMYMFKLLTKETAPDESAPLVDRSVATYGFLPNLHAVLAAAPATYQAYLDTF